MDDLKAYYRDRKGKDASWLGERLGWIGGQFTYDICNLLYQAFDRFVPDVPILPVKAAFKEVAGFVYETLADFAYYDFATVGDEQQANLDGITADFQNKINLTLSQAQRYADSVIGDLRQKAAALQTQINAAQSRLDTLNNAIKTAETTLETHGVRISALERKVSFAPDLTEFFGKLP